MNFQELAQATTASDDATHELFGQDRLERSAEWDGSTLKSVETQRDAGASLRRFQGDTMGFAYANEAEFDPVQLVDQARGVQSIMPGEPAHGPPENGSGFQRDDRWYDGTIESAPADRVEAVESNLEPFLDRSPVRTLQVQYQESSVRSRLFLDGEPLIDQKRTRYGISVWAVCERDGDVQTGFEHQTASQFGELDLGRIPDEAIQKGNQLLGAEPPESRTGPAVLTPEAASGLLKLVRQMTDGESVIKERSAWGEDRLGEDVAAASVTIVDDPAREGGASNTTFDDEGHTMEPVRLIDAGTYNAFLTNQYVSRKVNLPNNHRASRSFRQRPGVDSTNFYLQSGDTPFEDLLEELGEGPVITSIQPGSGLDSVSGHFSVGARGYFVENGEPARPFDEATVSGDIDKLLCNVLKIGETLPRGWSVASPALLVNEVSLGGGSEG